jgi:hypothetical protein
MFVNKVRRKIITMQFYNYILWPIEGFDFERDNYYIS